jgi:hypothetical protein
MGIRGFSRERHLDRLYRRLENRRCDWWNAHHESMAWNRVVIPVIEMAVIPISDEPWREIEAEFGLKPGCRPMGRS